MGAAPRAWLPIWIMTRCDDAAAARAFARWCRIAYALRARPIDAKIIGWLRDAYSLV